MTFRLSVLLPTLLFPALFFPALSSAQSGACKTTLSADAQLIVNDVSAIAAQAQAQGFAAAVQRLAVDLEDLLPSLNPPDQQAVEKLITDLATATSTGSPGGSSITASERIILTNDLSQMLLSTGMSASQTVTVVSDVTAVMTSLTSISTAQLQTDTQKLITDTRSCKR